MSKPSSNSKRLPQQKQSKWLEVDARGRITLPPELIAAYGLGPGTRVYLDDTRDGLHLRHPSRFLKLYLEPTNRCNLNCRTCIRHNWDGPAGMMSDATFARVLEGLSQISPKPKVFFGGFGEPLSHPKIISMVRQVKALGSPVEVITNATLLTPELSLELVEAGIDILWVSIDGATPESYGAIRSDAAFSKVLQNLTGFRDALNSKRLISDCGIFPGRKTRLGIAFVAMKRNIAELPAVKALAHDLDAKYLMVTNVLPYTEAMGAEILYNDTVTRDMSADPILRIHMPGIDAIECTRPPLDAIRYGKKSTWVKEDAHSALNRCPFIEQGAAVIGWDGGFSPCLALLYSHTGYVLGRERFSKKWIIGNLQERSLPDLWHDPEHIDFRQRVQLFQYAPCTSCGGCELADTNAEDCWGNTFPTCGGCLWAQGIIQCP